MSTRPNSSIASATRLVQESGSATSVATVSARRPVPFDQLRGVLEALGAAGAERHVGAGLGEALRERHAQPAGGAGDDGDLAVESEEVGDGLVGHAVTVATGPRDGTMGDMRRILLLV